MFSFHFVNELEVISSIVHVLNINKSGIEALEKPQKNYASRRSQWNITDSNPVTDTMKNCITYILMEANLCYM